MLLLDTSFLVLYEAELASRRIGPTRHFLRARSTEPVAISLISLGEFAEGFASPAEAEAFLSHFRVLQISRAIAYRMAALQTHLPQKLGENDAWIAATALVYGAGIVGRDAAFGRIPRLHYFEV
ncbi:MAG: type II toxin-antitoxin system VapC family toxin [Verrucomicrobiota bacterium]|nr:type II toxin-antitoxin system VapC family toxin [Verrucomicrobiota bacterium]